MEKQLFFFDMDGTLISGVTRKILPSSIQAIESLQKQGHLCFLCTGRSYQMAMEYSDVIHPDGVVFCNGAGIIMDGKMVNSHPIHAEDVKSLRRLCSRMCGGLQLLNESFSFQNLLNGFLIRLVYPKKALSLSMQQKQCRKSMVWMNRYHGQDILKADVFFFTKKQADSFFAQMPSGLQAIRTKGKHLHQAEIMVNSISKASGVEKVVEMLEVDPANTWCFGDSINDVEMMRVCGHSIAMGNGGSVVKEVADYVTDDNSHDGIAKALEYFGWRL